MVVFFYSFFHTGCEFSISRWGFVLFGRQPKTFPSFFLPSSIRSPSPEIAQIQSSERFYSLENDLHLFIIFI